MNKTKTGLTASRLRPVVLFFCSVIVPVYQALLHHIIIHLI